MTQARPDSVTVADVAREARLSKSTAARVLAGRGSVSPEARERVLAAAERLGYLPNALAQAMSKGVTNTVGVVIPDIANPFFSAVVRGLSDHVRSAGLEIIISNTDNDREIEARSLEMLAKKRVDGVVLAPVIPDGSETAQMLSRRGFPIVLLDRRSRGLEDLPLVTLDHEGAALLATSHLIDLGHRRIAVVCEIADLGRLDPSEPAHRPAAQRLRGYLRALVAAGIEPDRGLVIQTAYEEHAAADDVAARLPNLQATALFATDSVLTSGSFRALQALGMRLPEDISFVGFDDQDWTTLVDPPVTVLTQPRAELGRAAAEMLQARIADPAALLNDIELPGQMFVRASTAAIPRSH